MKILSVNVCLPREVLSGKDIVTTGIFKEPIEGPVKLRKLNLDGDKQADLTVHGGEDKAVYAYPKEHYDYWQRELGVKFGRMDIVRRFLASGRPGIYFKVLQEGEVEAGDSIDLISKDENNITVKDIVRLYVKDTKDVSL
jgi:MOSC domain-containing protein YiiM